MHRFSKTIMAGLITGGALLALPALAQLSSATIRGLITQSGAPAKTPVQILATNKATGITYKATTQGDGSYVMLGLAPGSYNLSVVGSKEAAQEVTVQIGETASIDLALSVGADAATLDRVQVVGSLQRKDVKTSEVGTSVSRQQIESLPQVTRNFLAFADMAPGVRFVVDTVSGNSKMQSGAQSADHVNVFIDGVSQKNYVTTGGVSGQDSSRGNPFPQAAIAEYKVISQNYKAEFDQVSSAAIIAVSKSGTNELHGEVFLDHTGSSLTKMDPFQEKQAAGGIPRPDFGQNQYGFSLGGAIVPDKIHYFLSYEAKDNTDPRQYTFQNSAGIANAGFFSALKAAEEGATTRTFKEDLLFGKIDWQLSDDQHLEMTAKYRAEKDVGLPYNWSLSGISNTTDRSNDETRLDIKHVLTRDNWLNEAHLGYESSSWTPHPTNDSPLIEYKTTGWADIVWAGGGKDLQTKGQTGTLLQDDLTYTGYATHTIKTGFKYKMTSFDLSGTQNAVVDMARFIQPDGSVNQTLNPDVVFSPATAPIQTTFKNNQFGIYLQDDWQVSKQLELNLGVRWDYEDNMLNNDYVMPADRVAALHSVDTRAGAAPGQTYAQSLAKGGINIDDYIGTGNRKAFTGAIQPRVGFSYDLKGDKESVVFAGWGRAYDRTIANSTLDELAKNLAANGEIWGIKNDVKMPYTDQFSIGLRQKLADWNGEIAYTHSQQFNQFVLFEGNRDPNGGFGGSGPADPLWGSVPGYGNLILGDFSGKTRTQTLFLKADKPYSKRSGWGATFAYTNSLGETTNPEGGSTDLFSMTSGPGGKFAGTVLHPSNDVERHRIVATGSADIPYGLLLSGKLTWGSGMNYTAMTCAPACAWGPATQDSTRQVDVGLSKDVAMPGNSKIVLRADVINLFNASNWGSYSRFPWDATYQQPTGMSGPMRTIKLGMKYVF
jgi:outer membrane receptor protein involved in Fe transport